MPASPTSGPPPQEGPPTNKQVATYIAEMATELSHYAKRPRFRTVRYLLDMVRLEAERAAKDLRTQILRQCLPHPHAPDLSKARDRAAAASSPTVWFAIHGPFFGAL